MAVIPALLQGTNSDAKEPTTETGRGVQPRRRDGGTNSDAKEPTTETFRAGEKAGRT